MFVKACREYNYAYSKYSHVLHIKNEEVKNRKYIDEKDEANSLA